MVEAPALAVSFLSLVFSMARVLALVLLVAAIFDGLGGVLALAAGRATARAGLDFADAVFAGGLAAALTVRAAFGTAFVLAGLDVARLLIWGLQ